MRRVLQLATIGTLIGLSASYIIVTLILLNDPERVMTGKELLEEVIIGGVLGVACGILSLIFDIERLSFSVKFIIHYLTVLLFVLIAGIFGHWYDLLNISTILGVIGIQLITYAIIFAAMHYMMRHDVNLINQKLKKSKV